MSCSDAVIHIHDCCALFLEGRHYVTDMTCHTYLMFTDTELAKLVGEVNFNPKPGPQEWISNRPWGTETSKQYSCATLLVTLRDQSTWAIDFNGSQYGYQDKMMSWGEYKKERVGSTANADHFGSSIRG